jgi:tyrosine-protein kinase Etk/Wzc
VKADLSYWGEAINDFRSKGGSVDLSLKAGAPSDSLVQVEAGINAMSINKIENSRRFTAEHPSYISLKRQQENLQEQRIKLGAKLAEFPETLAERLRRTRDFEPQQAILVTSDKRRQELAILGILLFGMLSLIIVLLRFRTFTTNEVAKANDYDPQKLPTKIWDKIADGKNLLTPQELDALLRPSKITD